MGNRELENLLSKLEGIPFSDWRHTRIMPPNEDNFYDIGLDSPLIARVSTDGLAILDKNRDSRYYILVKGVFSDNERIASLYGSLENHRKEEGSFTLRMDSIL